MKGLGEWSSGVRAIVRALRRLNGEQGLVGRRNARRAVREEMRRVLRAMDDEYPPIKSVEKGRVRLVSSAAIVRRLSAGGYVEIGDDARYALPAAAHGVHIRTRIIPGYRRRWFCPGWLVEAVDRGDTGKLGRLKRDRGYRREYLTKVALTGGGAP